MTRRGCYWLILLVLPAPAFALSPMMSEALSKLLNAQLVAALVLTAVVAIWVPRFLKRVMLEQAATEREVARLDQANYAALAEVDRRRAAFADTTKSQKPYLDDVSDEDFHTAMRAAGWSAIDVPQLVYEYDPDPLDDPA